MAKKSQPRYPDSVKALKAVAARFKALRIEKGYTNYENFAFKNDLNRSQVWRYENGEDLKISSLLKMLNALDVSLDEFFNEKLEKDLKEGHG